MWRPAVRCVRRCNASVHQSWLQIKLRLVNERIKSLQDWVVIADSDEFYDFDALGPGIQVGPPLQVDGRTAS